MPRSVIAFGGRPRTSPGDFTLPRADEPVIALQRGLARAVAARTPHRPQHQGHALRVLAVEDIESRASSAGAERGSVPSSPRAPFTISRVDLVVVLYLRRRAVLDYPSLCITVTRSAPAVPDRADGTKPRWRGEPAANSSRRSAGQAGRRLIAPDQAAPATAMPT
jgi:hypothetical protein